MENEEKWTGAGDAIAGAAFGRALAAIVTWLALIGGLILAAIAAMTAASVAGRYVFGLPVPGDYELVELGSGVAVFLFFPYCQMSGGNIAAAFFTDRLPARARTALEIVGHLAYAAVAALLTWRLALGGLRKLADGQSTMHLAMPIWWGYVPATLAIGLLVVVCLWCVYASALELRPRGRP